MAPIRTLLLTAFLAVTLVSAIPQPVPVPTATASTALSPSSTASAAEAEETVRTDGKGYYDSQASYDSIVDPMTADANLNEDGTNKGNGGQSKGSFMSMGLGAQIGIIVAVVVVALSMFGGAVWYYLRRRKVWEKEMIRRSTILQHKADGPIPPTPAGMPSNKEIRTDPATGKKFIAMKSSNLPPQTPTWKRWMTQDV